MHGQPQPRTRLNTTLLDPIRRTSLVDTCMEVESAVLFNVNPPSPQGSDYYSDEQDTILRTWHTGGGALVEQPLGFSHAMPHRLAEKGYVGAVTYDQATSTTIDQEGLPIKLFTRDTAKMSDLSLGPPQSTSAPPQEQFRTNMPTFRDSISTGSPSEPPAAFPTRKTPSNRRGGTGPGETNRKSELYKTELCISLSTGNPCRYGDQCQFAHSREELQHVNRHPRYKTQFCLSFQSQGYCKYNERCTFIHYPEEARVPLPGVPTSPTPLAEGSTSSQSSSQDASSPKDTRRDRIRALSEPNLATTSMVARVSSASLNASANAANPNSKSLSQNDSTPTEVSDTSNVRRRSTAVSFPPDVLYSMAHPQMAQFTEREYTTSAFPLVMACESVANVVNVANAVNNAPFACNRGQEPSSCPQVSRSTSATTSAHTLGLYPPKLDATDRVSDMEADGDVDEQWASALAHYISTPQNDFEM
ncbi:hypothetical protein BGZ94_001180 [Podila epigama]|nr:hypothetical protein BGZ94_001180 [Podila epigama]